MDMQAEQFNTELFPVSNGKAWLLQPAAPEETQ